jgi:hypothetical protein
MKNTINNESLKDSPNQVLGKRSSFEVKTKVHSETSSVSSLNNNILFDFEKKKLPKSMEGVRKSMMGTPGKVLGFLINIVDQLKKKCDKIMEICNILQHCGVPDIYFMSKEDIKEFIFDEDKIEKEVHTPKTTVSFNKPTKKPKII